MQNKRLIIVLTGAIFFGLLAAVSVSRYLTTARGATTPTKVVVAKVDIPLGTKIIPEQIGTLNFAPGTTPEGVFDSTAALVGRVVVTNIAAHEPITNIKLAAEGSAGGLSAVIPEGYRAMTVKVDDVMGLSGFVMPGTLVDIVVVIAPPEKSSTRDSISKIVLQNIKVLASGQNIDPPKNNRDVESVKTVTVLVTPDQAEKLALASTEGKLRLMMRNSVDQNDERTAGATKQSLLEGEHAMPIPDPGITEPQPPKPVVFKRPRPQQRPQSRPATQVLAPAALRLSTVDVFEGAKKKVIEFP